MQGPTNGCLGALGQRRPAQLHCRVIAAQAYQPAVGKIRPSGTTACSVGRLAKSVNDADRGSAHWTIPHLAHGMIQLAVAQSKNLSVVSCYRNGCSSDSQNQGLLFFTGFSWARILCMLPVKSQFATRSQVNNLVCLCWNKLVFCCWLTSIYVRRQHHADTSS